MIGLIVMGLIMVPLAAFILVGLFGEKEVRASKVPVHFLTAFFLISLAVLAGMFTFGTLMQYFL